jgi:hypothetical protein
MVGQLLRECVKGDKAAGVARIDRGAAEVAYKQQGGGRSKAGLGRYTNADAGRLGR